MRMIEVKSQAVEAVGYEGNTLTVRFRGGREYDYAGVPPAEFTELMRAPSMGVFVNQRIKGAYPEQRR